MKLLSFSLRELFLLVALAAMGCGWWVERTSLLSENAKLKDDLSRSFSLDMNGESTLNHP